MTSMDKSKSPQRGLNTDPKFKSERGRRGAQNSPWRSAGKKAPRPTPPKSPP